MGVTISTHNGSAYKRDHNIRNERVTSKEPHIDPTLPHEIWHDEKPRQAYKRLFGDAVRKYNAEQKRDDRKIKNYFDKVSKDSKQHPVYEMVIGIYGYNEIGGYLCPEELGKEIMHEFVKTWQERNPNLELIGAYYHADEPLSQPHVHIDYVPVAHGYKTGMETQAGLVKALGEQGFHKKGKVTAQIQWEARENALLDRLCRERGLEVDHPREEGRKHMDAEQYRAKKALESTINQTKGLLDAQDALRAETGKLEAQRDKAQQQAQKALERKARAVKRSFKKDKDLGYSYDRGLADELRKEVKAMREDVDAMCHTDRDIEYEYSRATQAREDALKRLEEASKERERLIQEGAYYKQQGEKYMKEAQTLIEQKSERKARSMFGQFMNKQFGTIGDREERLNEFCKDIKFKDGDSVLDRFEHEEQKLQAQIERAWEEHSRGFER